MPSLGSVTEGMTGTQLDLQNIQLNDFKLKEAPIKLQQDQIQLQQDKMALAQQTKMLSLMQNIVPPKDVNSPTAAVGVLTQLGLAEAESGNPAAAQKFLTSAMDMSNKASQVEGRNYKMQVDRLSRFAGVLGVVPDTPDGYASALLQMMDDPGVVKDPKFQALVKQGWHKGIAGELRAQAISERDRAYIQHQNMESLRDTATIELDKIRGASIRARMAREGALAKEGGKPIKPADLKLITSMALADHPDADKNDVNWRAYGVAEEMQRIMRDQHVSEGEAAQRAYAQSVNNKEWAGLKTTAKVTHNQQGMADAQENVIHQLDNMITKIDTMDVDPTGLKGRGYAILEHVGGLTGGLMGRKGAEVSKFREDVGYLQTTLLGAMTTSRYRSKDVQALLKKLADVTDIGMDAKVARGQLSELKALVEAEMKKSGITPTGDQPVTSTAPYEDKYDDAREKRYQEFKALEEKARGGSSDDDDE